MTGLQESGRNQYKSSLEEIISISALNDFQRYILKQTE
jgi:hypothetical protein